MTMRRDEIERVAPLTPVQLGMLFHALHDPVAGLYVEQGVCELNGPLDGAAFAQAWQDVLARHAALRTAFFWQGLSQPLQVAYGSVPVPLTILDAMEDDASAHTQAVEAALARHRAELHALDTPPLIRVDLIRLNLLRHRFVVSLHHLVHDAWSLQVLFGEVWSSYAIRSRGHADTLVPARPFMDFVLWQKNHAVRDAQTFWANTLAALPRQPSWSAEAKPAVDPLGDRYGHLDCVFDRISTATLQEHLATASLTINSAILGLWGILLACRGDHEDVVLGTVMLGRPQELEGVDRMVGVFINTLPLRLQVETSLAIVDWLQDVQQRQLSLHPYEHCSLSDIRAWAGDAADRVLFDTIVVCQQVFAPDRQVIAGDLRVSAFETRGQPHYPLMLRVTPGSRLRLELVYDRHRVADTLAGDVFAQVEAAVHALTANAGMSVGQVRELMTTVDRSRVEDRRRARRLPRGLALPAAAGTRVDRD